MDEAAMRHSEGLIVEAARERFPGGSVQRVALLQYGDDPVIEPGELLVRVFIEAADGEDGREQALDAFERAHRSALKEFRRDLAARLPEVRRLEFLAGQETGDGPRIALGRPAGALEGRGRDLTPVMARLGPLDLETLDTLITAGIAANRADAVRWALARIRERPAYERLRERAREIDELRAQF
jgi:hypothetical protein